MQASELLNDLLGYDDEYTDPHQFDEEYNNHFDDENNNNSNNFEYELTLDSGSGEEGEMARMDFYKMLKQQEANVRNWVCVQSSSLKENECSICLMEEELTALPCSHRFCNDCLSYHVKTQIKSRNIQHMRCYPRKNKDGILEIHIETLFGAVCPHIGCNYVIQDLRPYVNEKDLVFFDDKCLDLAVLKMRLLGELKPCPRGCGYIVQENCLCVNETCRKRQLWFAKLDERQKAAVLEKEKLAMKMQFRHDKKCCPKCFVEITKNGGCDHMHCTMCDTHFSWSAAPEYGLSFSWFKEQTQKLFKEPKILRKSENYFILTTSSPFKKRRYFAQREKYKRKNK